MAGQVFIPHGTTVTFSSDTIGGLQSIGMPSRTRGSAEKTASDSGGDRGFLPGLRDGGEVQLVARKIPGDAGQAALLSNYESNSLGAEEMVITFPDDATDDSTVTTLTFDCFVTDPGSGELDLIGDEVAENTFTLKVDGAVTEATA